MRTRIALVVAVPVAVITVSCFTQTASAHSAPTTTTARTVPTTAQDHAHRHAVTFGLPFDSGAAVLVPRSSPIKPLTSRRLRTVPRSTTHTSKAPAKPTGSAQPPTAPAKVVPATPTTMLTPTTLAPSPIAPTATAAATIVPTTTATTAPAPASPTTTGPVDTVTPEERAEWEQVALCEEGGDWQYDGGSYSGGLGISRANWDAYGGLEYAPDGAAATEDQQIMVAERIQFDPPDRDGCSGW